MATRHECSDRAKALSILVGCVPQLQLHAAPSKVAVYKSEKITLVLSW